MTRALTFVAIFLLLTHGTAFGLPRGDFTAGLRVPYPASPPEFANAYGPGLGLELGWLSPLTPALGLTLGYEQDLIPFDGEKALRDAGLEGILDPPTRSAHEHRLLLGLRQTFGARTWRPFVRVAAGATYQEIPDVTVVPNGYSIGKDTGTGFALVGGGGVIWRPFASGPELTLGADYATAWGEFPDADAVSARLGFRYTQGESAEPQPSAATPEKPKRWFVAAGTGLPLGSGTLATDYKSGFGFGGGWEIPWSERLSGTIRFEYDQVGFDEEGFREGHGFGPGSQVEGDNASVSSLLLAVRAYAAPTGRTPYVEAGFGRTSQGVSYSASEPNHIESNSSASGGMTVFAAAGFRMARERPGGFAEVSIAWFAPDDDMSDHAMIARVRVGVIR